MTISVPNSRGRRKTHERKCMAPDFAWRRTAGILARSVLPLQELFSQQLQEQNCRRRSARNGALGNAQGDSHDLSCGPVSPSPLAQGRGSAHGAGHHPRQHGRQKAQSQKRCDFANHSQAAGEAPPSYSREKRKAKAEEKENSNFQNQKCDGRSAGCPRAGGQRRHPLSDDWRLRRGQDGIFPIPESRIRLRLRHELFGARHQGRPRT